jgi:LmbE family N-acetylglucosaminyl deacetylase
MDSQKSVLVVSAHAADFVWRAGGAIALYAQKGYRVRILCLSFGERGESERLWKKEGMTVECVKQERQKESERAAGILGAEIRFFDSGDYPIKASEETIHEMVVEFRKLQPEVVLTHSYEDPYNPDHPYANMLTLQTRVYASLSRKCCSTSRRCMRSKRKPWSRWKRRSTCGIIIATWRSAAAHRQSVTPAKKESSTPRRIKGFIHRWPANFPER